MVSHLKKYFLYLDDQGKALDLEATADDYGLSIEAPRGDCSDVKTETTGAFFSDSCAKNCLAPGTNNTGRDLCCFPCGMVVHEQDFRERAARSAVMGFAAPGCDAAALAGPSRRGGRPLDAAEHQP